jgi:hypothetical protein
MKRTDQEQLLNDVLADESEAGLNAAVLDQLLQLARRRRRLRQVWRGGVAAVVVAAVVVAFLFQLEARKPKADLARKPIVPPNYETVTTFALTAEQLVSNQPLSPEQTVLSGGTVVEVRTTGANFHSVNDEELLELAKPSIAVLVRRSPQEAELVFVEPLANHN